MQNIFITGTDTDIGKTVLSFLMVKYFFDKGAEPFYLKPFQTGCSDPEDRGSDADFVYKNINQLSSKNRAESVIYCFKNPKAPFFAARDDGVSIQISKLTETILEKSNKHNPVIIEGAGGLFVPIDSSNLIIDIVQNIKAKIILTARAGLGTINHTLLSVEALKSRGIHNPSIVIMKQSKNPVSEEMLKENIEAIEHFSKIKIAGIIEPINNFSNINKSQSATIEKILSL